MDDTKRDLLDPSSLQHRFEELQERASKDTLSGLLNRGTAELYINQRLQSMKQEDVCALFIVDLDDFKRINDTLGHQAGDQAILQAARSLSGLFRATDIVGRLGGDEFLVFISGRFASSLVRRKGQEICQRLQATLGNIPSITMTVSVGIYITSGGSLTFDELYQSADLALYKAKKAGKRGFFIKYGNDLPGNNVDHFLPVSVIPLGGLLEYIDSGVALLEMTDPIRLLYVSPSFCRIIGVKPGTYSLPCPLSRFIHPDDLVDLEQALQDGLANDHSVDHTLRVSADGTTWFWWHVRATKIEYSSPHPVMLVTATDISRFKENEEQLRSINERLESAFEQTAQDMWEIDLATRTFTLYHYGPSSHTAESSHGEFPESLLASGWIHPKSAERFKTFAQELLDGRMQGFGNFMIQYHDTGCYGWATLSYRRLCDEAGRTGKAVGIIEKLPQDFSGPEAQSIPKRVLPHTLTPYLTGMLLANLSRNSVRELWIEGKDLSGTSSASSCSEVLGQEVNRIFSADERQSLEPYFDREHLLESYACGEQWGFLEYRRVDDNGSIRWVNGVISLAEDPFTRDVYLFVYLVQTDIRHQRERESGIELVRDSVTGLYDRATTRVLVEHQMRKDAAARPCALAVLYLGGLNQLCVSTDPSSRKICRWVANAISAALAPSCVVGQYGRDQLLVFFSEITSREEVKQELDQVFAFVRLSLAKVVPMDSLRFVAGAVCTRTHTSNYVAMTAQCVQLCELWHNAAADTVVFAEEHTDWNLNELQHSDAVDQVSVSQDELKRPLSEDEKDVALQCVEAMLSADTLADSIQNVLSYIGNYYQADRAYVLGLAGNRHVITMPYEWTSPQKASIQQAVSGLLVDRFPIFSRCMKERTAVFLTRSQPYLCRPNRQTQGPWHFTVFPLMDNNSVNGFLCVENARSHPGDAALFTFLVPHIIGERKRFSRHAPAAGDTSALSLSEMPNLRSYMNVIYTLSSDLYSSLGAVCLDIPGLSSINGSLGFEYGSKLLWYVSKTLADIFGRNFLFRTWDAEFVALCPDTTRPVFIGHCARLRSALQRRYPKDFRIGYAWSDGVFNGKDLVNEARSIMRCEQVSAAPASPSLNLGGTLHRTSEAVRLGRFTVYFQPKVRMSSGALVGAEALVRGLDDAGNLVSPGRFIRQLEDNGDIRDLDLYVLDRTLALMDRWRQEGRPAFPVSVNFSRFTLFDPSVPASVLAIQSRYPLLAPHLLELEITESAGSMDSRALSDVMDRFRQFGIHFALDDFGSQYANIAIFTHVKFDCVKLDRTLIADLASNARSQMLVRDLVEICHSSGMHCVAEGVETQAQVEALARAGCIYGQGYCFDRPLSADAFEKKYLFPTHAG